MRPWLMVSLVLTAAATAVSFLAYHGTFGPLPDPTPVHWGFDGKPDKWVPAADALGYLLIPPIMMAGMMVLGLILPWLSPRQFNLERFRRTYEHILILLMLLFAYIHAALLLSYFQAEIDGVRLLVGGLMIFFALLGNLMGKVRRNFWVGVRTPWTLASEAVWERTHRVTAWLWTAGGLVLGVAVLLGLPVLWAAGPFFAMALYPILYSLWLYKKLEKEGKLHDGVEPADLQEVKV